MLESRSLRSRISQPKARTVATFSATVTPDWQANYGANLLKKLAGTTGLEPATSCVTGMRSNQLNYVPK